jgi:chromosome segregation ATPase
VNRLHRELPSLKKQVERFKTERASLQTEVTSLRSERDSLRIEVDYEHDQNIYLQEITISTEHANEQGQGGDAGRLNRRIWALEQKNEDMERELEAQKVKYEEDVEKERGVSGGLRDRIGTLEEKRKKVVSALEEVEGRETGLKGELEALRANSRADIARLERELEEARASTANTAEKVASSMSRPQLLAAEQAEVALTRSVLPHPDRASANNQSPSCTAETAF